MHRLILAALLLAPLPAAAQTISPEAEAAANAGRQATQCALLAAGSGGKYAREAERLAELGYRQTHEAFNEFTIALADTAESGLLGPLTEFLQERSADFWTGTYFASDAEAINLMMAQRHPFSAGDSYEHIMAQRKQEAEREFERRECAKLGR